MALEPSGLQLSLKPTNLILATAPSDEPAARKRPSMGGLTSSALDRGSAVAAAAGAAINQGLAKMGRPFASAGASEGADPAPAAEEGGLMRMRRKKRKPRSASETAAAAAAATAAGFSVGSEVLMQGLASRPELNGVRCSVLNFDESKGRYNVQA